MAKVRHRMHRLSESEQMALWVLEQKKEAAKHVKDGRPHRQRTRSAARSAAIAQEWDDEGVEDFTW